MSATKEKTRFDTRLPKEQKKLFERAAALGGFRNLTEFVIRTVQERANQIIEDNEKIIASKRDAEIFIDAILNPAKPNKYLREAAEEYKKHLLK